MLFGIFVLITCQLAGEIIANAMTLPIPGAVIGIVLLTILLAGADFFPKRGRHASTRVEKAGNGLLACLGLFFIPAGVGIIDHLDLVLEHGLPLALVLIVSILATLVVVVWTFLLVRRLTGGELND